MPTSLKSESIIFNKVPEITLLFWFIKIMATTVGETAADFLAVDLKFGLITTSYIMGFFLLIFLFLQVRAKKYIPWIYWITVVLISIVGTLITDNLVDNMGIKLEMASALFGIALLANFIAWQAREKTLSIHSIFTTRRELFYWVAILFTFAFGTAAGDLSAESLKLGYAVSAIMFGGLIAVVTMAYYFFKLNAVAAFWVAYILTRPFGASFGDLLSQSQNNGGLGLGTVKTSGIFLLLILGMVLYLTLSRKKSST